MRVLSITQNATTAREFQHVYVFYVTVDDKRYAAIFLEEFRAGRDAMAVYIPDEYVNVSVGDTLENFIVDSLRKGCLIIDETKKSKKGLACADFITLEALIKIIDSVETREYVIGALIKKAMGDKNKNEGN